MGNTYGEKNGEKNGEQYSIHSFGRGVSHHLRLLVRNRGI
jgi:hypothetical protein